jgi:hypothetical protein
MFSKSDSTVSRRLVRARRGRTIRNTLWLAVATAVIAALAPGTSSAAVTLSLVNAKLSCMVRFPAAQYGDYTWYGLLGAPQPSSANIPPAFIGFDPGNSATYPAADPPLRNWGPTTGLDLAYGVRPSMWLLGVKRTSTCLRKFGIAANPHARPASSYRAVYLARLR